MNQWSDDELVTRLTASLIAHEVDADPATAQRIALSVPAAPRRRWPVVLAAVAVVVLVAGLASYAVHDRGSAPEPSGVATSGVVPAPAVTPEVPGTDRALAKAAAARLLETFPVPPGSTRSSVAPVPRLSHQAGGTYGETDRSLTAARWWVVPLSYADLVGWYASHTPANPGSTYSGLTSTIVPNGELYWQLADPDPDRRAYSAPAGVVSYAQLTDDTTAIRAEVTLAARYDRAADTLVPHTVTRIDIVKSAIDGPPSAPTIATVTDPEVIARVVSRFDGLAGDYVVTELFGCGSPVGIDYDYAVTFHWPGHLLVVDPGAALCGEGRGLTLDGTRLPQTLEDTDAFDGLLEAALAGS